MGISGLLPLLKDITQKAHIKDFRGKRAAVDGYVWLYKGSYSCPEELCEGKPTDRFVKYCMSMVDLLLHHGVQPIVVLDGDKMPAKAITEQHRQSSRAANRERGRQLAAAGNKRAAMEMYQRAVEVTPQMARAFMEALTAAGVTFIVAPYEADAQMAYLAKRGLVDIVITEDSDLLVYGCPQVVFKLARTGECDHIKLEDIPMNRNPSFAGFSHENFVEVRPTNAITHGANVVPDTLRSALDGYRVWCPLRRTMVHLAEIPNGNIADSRMFVPDALPEGGDLSFLGAQKPDDLSCAVAEGRIDPMTHKPFVVSIVDGIFHVAPPDHEANDQHLPARLTAPAAVPSHQPSQSHMRRLSQPGHILSFLHKSTGADGSSTAACGHRGSQPRASAPGRVQHVSQSHQSRNLAEEAMVQDVGAASKHAMPVSASSGCRYAKQSTNGHEAAKVTLVETAMSMRGRLLAALTARTKSKEGDAGADRAGPTSIDTPSAPYEQQAAEPLVDSGADKALRHLPPPSKDTVHFLSEGRDQTSAPDLVTQQLLPSQTESGDGSALSLLTTSSMSQGKGQDLLKGDSLNTGRSPLACMNNTLPCQKAGLAAHPSQEASRAVDKKQLSTEAALPNDSDTHDVFTPIPDHPSMCGTHGPRSSAPRQRGSLKELLQKSRSCNSIGRIAAQAKSRDHLNDENNEDDFVDAIDLPEQKTVADLKRCKYALSKVMPFKKPRRELRRL